MSTDQSGRTIDGEASGPTVLARGATVGRYLILNLIGRGGMGEVYAAYDPELDRKIALKLLNPRSSAGVDPSEGRARLLREAQAIARLSDPNVVVVFDVGTYDTRVFLAMEFVDGNTLGFWMQARTRTWREVLTTYIAAGRGLAAAHRAGVVHRDFKPENVMMGRDGKVRVMDFGLARAIEPEAEAPATADKSRTPTTPTKVIAVAGAGARASIRVSASVPPGGSTLVGQAVVVGDAPRGRFTLRGMAAAKTAEPTEPTQPAAEGTAERNVAAYVRAEAPVEHEASVATGSEDGSSGTAAALSSSPASSAPPSLPSSSAPPMMASSSPTTMMAAEHAPPPPATSPAPWAEGDDSTRDLSREAAAVRASLPSVSALDSPLTVTGALMGTPAYMAPEQFRGGAVDARADQFSFCVALYEGLYGERPFEGKNIQQLTASVLAGRVRHAPGSARVPGWLRRILLRGLRANRDERFPSMDALLTTLTRDPAKTRRRWATAAGVTAGFVLLGAGLVRAEHQKRMRCAGSDAKLAGIWELPNGKTLSPRKEAIRGAFMATGKRYAADSFNVVRNALDRYVTDWNTMHRDACEATNLRGEQSDEVLDLRMACLNDRFSEVRALTNVLTSADGDVVSKAAEAVQSLRPIEPCADIVALRAVVKPPDDPAVRKAVEDVRTALADVKAERAAGRYKQAMLGIVPAVAAARTTRYRPVVAEALSEMGFLELLTGDPVKGEKSYEESAWTAEAARDDEVAAEAMAQLVAAVGYYQRRFAEAERWASQSAAEIERLGPGHERISAWRTNNLALVYEGEGRLEESLATHREALALKIAAFGEAHFDVAVSLGNIALNLAELGRLDEAHQINQRALDILGETLGQEHPNFAILLSNGAEYSTARKHFSESQVLATRALAILEREFGENHMVIAYPLTTMGWNLIGEGTPEPAIPVLERALRIREKNEPDRARLGETRFALAQALFEGGRASSVDRVQLLINRARGDFASAPGSEKRTAELEAWVDSHARAAPQVSMR